MCLFTSIVGTSVSILLHCSQIPLAVHFLLVGLWVVPLLYTGFMSWTEAHVECVCSFHSVFIVNWLPTSYLFSHIFFFIVGLWCGHDRVSILPVIAVRTSNLLFCNYILSRWKDTNWSLVGEMRVGEMRVGEMSLNLACHLVASQARRVRVWPVRLVP